MKDKKNLKIFTNFDIFLKCTSIYLFLVLVLTSCFCSLKNCSLVDLSKFDFILIWLFVFALLDTLKDLYLFLFYVIEKKEYKK